MIFRFRECTFGGTDLQDGPTEEIEAEDIAAARERLTRLAAERGTALHLLVPTEAG